jgi:sugar phosphate isomerase/epimerase
MKLGLFIPFDELYEERFSGLKSMGFQTCQLVCRDEQWYTAVHAEGLKQTAASLSVEMTAFWSSLESPVVWDFQSGPLVIGIVPRAYRFERMKSILRGADFAARVGIQNIATHAGFIPENPADSNYREVVCALRYLAQRLKENDQNLLLETGQETPVTLKRAIDDAQMDNIGVNFDPANFLMYGTANPVDAVGLLAGHIMGVHAKDGEYPVNGRELGLEKPLGEGGVNYPLFIEKLKASGYDGPLTIEREITGPQQKVDIIKARKLLETLI